MKPVLFVFVCILLLHTGCVRRQASAETYPHYFSVRSRQDLRNLLQYTPDRTPLVSAHRGGAAAGYPENCLATFGHTLQQTHAIIEFDVQLSKDDSLVIMHDNTLDRTSDGTGKVADHTFAELRKLHLEDPDGKVTPYHMPTLSEVLQWAKGKTILTVDVKKGLPATRIVSAIAQHYAQPYALVITYSIAQMKEYYQLDSTLSFTTNVENFDHLKQLEESGVPPDHIVAFVGIRQPEPALYEALHRRGIKCTLGTMKLEKDNPDPHLYATLASQGADIFATDKPMEASKAVSKRSRSRDRQYFSGNRR